MGSAISNIWYTFCPVCTVSHVALQAGFLREEFLKDNIELSYIGNLPVKDWQAHFSHKHSVLFRDGGNIPPIWARSEGADTKVLGMTWCNEGQALLVAPDSPIQSVSELGGKK